MRLTAIPAYFAFRIASALILLKLSAQFLTVRGFADFTQFLTFASLLNMAVVGGAQNGLIRQAAAATDAEVSEVHGAGLTILAGAAPVLGIPILLFSAQISRMLTGIPEYSRVVIALAILSLAAGPGQVCWSMLSGRKRVAQSLGAQGFGLLLGTAAAAWFIVRGNVAGAALAFAAGPVLATLATIPLVRDLRLSWRPVSAGLRHLLAYSAAIASTLAFTAVTLFALRWIYRDHFGSTELGYWLAANRISDMSTQFTGLFLLQAFVPQLAATQDGAERSRLIVRYGLVGACFTGLALLVFFAAGRPLVHLLLSDSYLPAIPSIRLYMVGDCFRVWVSLAMFTAFSAGKPSRYAAIEISTMATMAGLTLLLIRMGEVKAPQIAYASAFGLAAFAVGAAWLLRRGRRPPGPWPLRPERRMYPLGSVPRLP
jgi:O-antigen/teichoic acid export membrane protein